MSQRPQQVRRSGIRLTLGGRVSGHQNPGLRPVLETSGGDRASPASTLPPRPTHTAAKKRNLTHDWPSPRGSGRKMKHFWVSELSKRLGCSTWPESRERRGAGVARPPPRGTGSPQNVFMQHLGVRGRGVLLPPRRTGLFQFLGGAVQAG